ncbi:hypothetical protein Ciccas_005179 [Cichlidogyrus casuarinus]|uniref:Uncharacterized protein n=1 Tax=Cichlidogyrus casuarinus TaxID=1844966 RepID=A0ABD2Q9C9_9PLAT
MFFRPINKSKHHKKSTENSKTTTKAFEDDTSSKSFALDSLLHDDSSCHSTTNTLAFEIDKNDPSMCISLIRLSISQTDYDYAFDVLDHLLSIRPRHPIARSIAIKLSLACNSFEDCLAHCVQLLDQYPGDCLAIYGIQKVLSIDSYLKVLVENLIEQKLEKLSWEALSLAYLEVYATYQKDNTFFLHNFLNVSSILPQTEESAQTLPLTERPSPEPSEDEIPMEQSVPNESQDMVKAQTTMECESSLIESEEVRRSNRLRTNLDWSLDYTTMVKGLNLKTTPGSGRKTFLTNDESTGAQEESASRQKALKSLVSCVGNLISPRIRELSSSALRDVRIFNSCRDFSSSESGHNALADSFLNSEESSSLLSIDRGPRLPPKVCYNEWCNQQQIRSKDAFSEKTVRSFLELMGRDSDNLPTIIIFGAALMMQLAHLELSSHWTNPLRCAFLHLYDRFHCIIEPLNKANLLLPVFTSLILPEQYSRFLARFVPSPLLFHFY